MPDGTGLITIERPWAGNMANVSCIPTGEYKCAPRYYNKGGYDAVEICNVPDRSAILFHVGNYVSDSCGCVLVNSDYSYLDTGIMGTSSQIAFDIFMDVYRNTEFDLTVQNFNGGSL